jgi:hypothetical protein
VRLRFLGVLVYFLSAYAPLSLMFVVNDVASGPTRLEHPIPLLAVLGICAACVVLTLKGTSLLKGQFTATVRSASNRSADLFNYSIPYIVSFTGLKVTDCKGGIVFGIFMLVLLNPVLAIVGYQLYEVEYQEAQYVKSDVALTKLHVERGKRYEIARLAPHILLISKEVE